MSRRAVDTICAHCWTYTLTGSDGDVAALTATVDNQPVSRTGELLAVISGRATFELDIRGALHRRDRWMLRSPARGAVYTAHRCDQPIPPTWRAPSRQPRPAPATEESF